MRAFTAELALRTVKIIDIGYVTAIYFLIGIFTAKIFDSLYGKYDKEKEKKKSLLQHTLEIVGMMWLFGVIIYIVRNLVELIPSPFDGLFGFKHGLLGEMKNASVYTFIFLYFQSYFNDKIVGYYNSLTV